MRTIALASAGVVFARAITSTTAAAMILHAVVVVVVAGFGWFVNVIDDAFCILFDALPAGTASCQHSTRPMVSAHTSSELFSSCHSY